MNQSDDDIFGRNIDQLDRETPRFNLSEEEDNAVSTAGNTKNKANVEKKQPSIASVQPYSRASSQSSIPVMSPHPIKKPIQTSKDMIQHPTSTGQYYNQRYPVNAPVKSYPIQQVKSFPPNTSINGLTMPRQHHPPMRPSPGLVPQQTSPQMQTPFMNQLMNSQPVHRPPLPPQSMNRPAAAPLEPHVPCYCPDCIHPTTPIAQQVVINSERQKIEDEILLRQRELDSCWQEDEVDCPRDFTAIDRKKEKFYAERADGSKFPTSVHETTEQHEKDLLMNNREVKTSAAPTAAYSTSVARKNHITPASSSFGPIMKTKAKAVVSPFPRNTPAKKVNINTIVSQFSYSNDPDAPQDYTSTSCWPQSELGSRIPSSERITLSPLCMSGVPSGVQTPLESGTGQIPLQQHDSPSGVPSATTLQQLPGHEKKNVLDKFKGNEQYQRPPNIPPQPINDSVKDFTGWPRSEMGSRIPSSERISLSPLTMSGVPSAVPSGIQTPAEPNTGVVPLRSQVRKVEENSATPRISGERPTNTPAERRSSSEAIQNQHEAMNQPLEHNDALQDYSQFPQSELTSRVPSFERICLSPLCQSGVPSGCQTPQEESPEEKSNINEFQVTLRPKKEEKTDAQLETIMSRLNIGENSVNGVPRFDYREQDTIKVFSRPEQSSRMQSYESLNFTPPWSATTSGIVTPCDHSSLYGGAKPIRQQPLLEECEDEYRGDSTDVKPNNESGNQITVETAVEGYNSAPEIKNQAHNDTLLPPSTAPAKRRNSWSSGESTSSVNSHMSTVVNAPTSMHNTAPGSPDADGSEASDSVISEQDVGDDTGEFPDTFSQNGSPPPQPLANSMDTQFAGQKGPQYPFQRWPPKHAAPHHGPAQHVAPQNTSAQQILPPRGTPRGVLKHSAHDQRSLHPGGFRGAPRDIEQLSEPMQRNTQGFINMAKEQFHKEPQHDYQERVHINPSHPRHPRQLQQYPHFSPSQHQLQKPMEHQGQILFNNYPLSHEYSSQFHPHDSQHQGYPHVVYPSNNRHLHEPQNQHELQSPHELQRHPHELPRHQHEIQRNPSEPQRHPHDPQHQLEPQCHSHEVQRRHELQHHPREPQRHPHEMQHHLNDSQLRPHEQQRHPLDVQHRLADTQRHPHESQPHYPHEGHRHYSAGNPHPDLIPNHVRQARMRTIPEASLPQKAFHRGPLEVHADVHSYDRGNPHPQHFHHNTAGQSHIHDLYDDLVTPIHEIDHLSQQVPGKHYPQQRTYSVTSLEPHRASPPHTEALDNISVISFASMAASHQNIDTKADMMSSLLSMLGTHDPDDMARTLLAMSSSPDSCAAMRQSGCVSLLIQLLHSEDYEIDGINWGARQRAGLALHNIVHSSSGDRRGKREIRVLRLLEIIRSHSEVILSKHDDSYRSNRTAQPLREHGPGPAVAAIMKLSFEEDHKNTICELGGLQTVGEILAVDFLANKECNDPYAIALRKYAGMVLINLTYNDAKNKAVLCTMTNTLKAIIGQLQLTEEEDLIQVFAGIIRNISWRPDDNTQRSLQSINAVRALMLCIQKLHTEVCIRAVLSAVWNLSAHNSENKEEICRTPGSLKFLAFALSYRSPSKSIVVAENAGGILRNISSHIAVNSNYRAILREEGCMQTLVSQLRSPSTRVVSNSCGVLWNLSARCVEDQELLWELGAVSVLKTLINSKHKSISASSAAALRNLLAVKPGSGTDTESHVSFQHHRSNSLPIRSHSQRNDKRNKSIGPASRKQNERGMKAGKYRQESAPGNESALHNYNMYQEPPVRSMTETEMNGEGSPPTYNEATTGSFSDPSRKSHPVMPRRHNQSDENLNHHSDSQNDQFFFPSHSGNLPVLNRIHKRFDSSSSCSSFSPNDNNNVANRLPFVAMKAMNDSTESRIEIEDKVVRKDILNADREEDDEEKKISDHDRTPRSIDMKTYDDGKLSVTKDAVLIYVGTSKVKPKASIKNEKKSKTTPKLASKFKRNPLKKSKESLVSRDSSLDKSDAEKEKDKPRDEKKENVWIKTKEKREKLLNKSHSSDLAFDKNMVNATTKKSPFDIYSMANFPDRVASDQCLSISDRMFRDSLMKNQIKQSNNQMHHGSWSSCDISHGKEDKIYPTGQYTGYGTTPQLLPRLPNDVKNAGGTAIEHQFYSPQLGNDGHHNRQRASQHVQRSYSASNQNMYSTNQNSLGYSQGESATDTDKKSSKSKLSGILKNPLRKNSDGTSKFSKSKKIEKKSKKKIEE